MIKDTEAFTGTGALLNTTKDSEDSSISISAKNAEALRNITIQGAGGTWAGIAGATNLTYITATTKAFTGSNTSLVQGTITYDDKGKVKDVTKADGSISVKAAHDIGSAITRIGDSEKSLAGMSSYVIGAEGSAGGSIGAAVDVAEVVTRTDAYIGNGSTVKTKGDLSVDAADTMKDISSTALSASVGAVGITGSFSVYNFGSDLTDDDKKTLSAKAEKDGAEQTLTDWLDKELKNTNISKGFETYDSGALTTVKAKLSTEYSSAAPTLEGEKGTMAAIGGASSIEAGNVSVKADDQLTVDQKMGSVTGSALVSAGATVTKVTTDTLTQAQVGSRTDITSDGNISVSAASKHHMENHVAGAAISAVVGLQGTVSTWNDTSRVRTTIGDDAKLTAEGAVRITSANTRTMNSALVGATAALFGAANGAVTYASIEGDSLTTIGNNVTITSEKTDEEGEVSRDDIVIDASADTTLIAGTVGAAVGAFGGTGTGTSLASNVTAKTSVGKSAKFTGKDISITAENTPILKATATSAGLGLAGVGITVAKTDSKDKAQVTVGDSTTLTADDALTIKASMAKPSATDGEHAFGLNGYASATAGAGGVVSGAVATAFVDTDQVTSVEIGSQNTFTAKTAAITSDHQDAENVMMNTISAGASTGLGGQMGTTVKSDSHVTIGDGSSITTTDETKILASNDTEKAWRDGSSSATATVGGAGLAAGSGVVNETSITHNTNVNLGKVTLSANAADLTDKEKASGVTLYDKNAIDINAKSKVISKDDLNLTTGAAILSSYAKNKNTVTANTAVTVGDGATLKAGDTEGVKETHTETYTDPSGKSYSKSYRGGSIAVGTRNDAELDSSTMVDIYGAAGHAGSSNDVTYNNHLSATFGGTAETAKGDISIAAGRDSSGKTGIVKVTARSDVLNATVVPLSYTYDPTATVKSTAQLKLTEKSNLQSDRDILLKAKTGDITAMGYGETKSWVNSVKDMFGEGVSIGKTVKDSNANVEINGKAETGIHRKKSISIGGYIDSTTGKWVTTVTGNGDVSYSFSASKAGGSDLYEQYEALKQKLEEYGADPAAKAGYEAEMQFLQQKMVEQGLAYYDEKGNFVLVKNAGSTPEIDEAKTQLGELQKQQTEAIAGFTEVIKALDKEKSLLEDMKAAHKQAMDAKAAHGADSDAYKYEVEIYQKAVKKHNDTMGSSYYSLDVNDISTEQLEKDVNAVSQLETYYTNLKAQWSESTEINQLDNQIKATENFFKLDGAVEDTATGGFKLGDQTVVAVDANGKPVNPKETTEPYYYLLHCQSYNYLIHDVELGDITSQLGDIDLEGDNVYGTGSLTASGYGSVSISNNSPDNLKVGNVYVVGDKGTAGAGQGGAIYYNNSLLRGNKSQVADTIKEFNKDKSKSVGFSDIQNRDSTDAPTVEIKNEFNPSNHTLQPSNTSKGLPVFGASQTYLTGYIYNPRGSVHGVSEYGDIYNEGQVLAGSVRLEVKNGDYIQSYNIEKSGTVSNIGGAPLTDTGAQKAESELGDGILANGNIFISARYLNINSKIQSGYSDVSIHIPEEGKYKLYYMNGSEKKYVTSKADLPTDHSVTVRVEGEGLSDEGAQLLSFDFDSNRFLLNDVETGGGHISLVGTILNTTKNTDKAKIQARDGYGNITVINDSAKDLEIQSLSTGTGAKGVIEITDLDYKTGQITRKTTYTRENGKVQAVVEEYKNGKATGNSRTDTYGDAATYAPDNADGKGLWYNFQTGQQTSYTATYKFEGTKFDWWGIKNRDPTVEEMEKQGVKTSDYSQGQTSSLNGGAFVSDAWQNGTVKSETDDYKVSTNTSNVDKQVVGFYKEAYRPFWTLWTSKKYNYTLVEKKTDLQVTQSSIRADNPIGISFTGSADGGKINITNTQQTNIRLNGTIQNGEGDTSLTTKNGSILQDSAKGIIYTKDLTLSAAGEGGNAGTAEAAIATTAKHLTASSEKGSVAVAAEDNTGEALTLGNVSAATTISITSDGSIAQDKDAVLRGERIELNADDGIYGQKTTADDGTVTYTALITQLTAPTTAAYGLYARAYDDILIKNEQYTENGETKGGDMYIDSVISARGDVKLETEGSFRDANFTDIVNQSATEKLLHWADKAVLENKDKTIAKQKSQLQALVEGKYSEYQSLKAHVDAEGKYILDDDTRAMLVKAGYDDDAIAKYSEDQQVRYNSLKNDWKVDTWTEAEITNYVNTLDDTLYGNSKLTDDDIKGDNFLSAKEKANCLVNSAKSAEQLLITYTPGGIKDGITDTRTTIKAVPHVAGNNVTLNALGHKTAEDKLVDGDIGHKGTGLVIDISEGNIANLTAAELLALSSAERGDFNYDAEKSEVTVSYVEAITADANGTVSESGEKVDGTVQARAEAGSIYLESNEAFNKGSSFYSTKEMRLKAAGDIDGIEAGVGAGENLILESGDGAIKDVTITGEGILTARAKDGVKLEKNDGDLIIYTVYAAEGDVDIDLKDKGSLYSVSGHDSGLLDGEIKIGTSFVNVQGENVSIRNAQNVKGIKDPVTENDSFSVGIKATGKSGEEGSVGTVKVGYDDAYKKDDGSRKEGGLVDVTLFGETASAATRVEGKETLITNQGHITAGTFTGSDRLTVFNTENGTIEGSELAPTWKGGKDKTEESLKDGLAVINQGIIRDGVFTAEGGNLVVANDGQKSDEESVKGVIDGTTFVAQNDVSYNSYNDATTRGITIKALNGSATVADKDASGITIKELTAATDAKVSVKEGSLQVTDSLTAGGTADIDTKGDLYVKNLTAKNADLDVSEGHAKVDKATVTEKISIDTLKGNIETGTVTTKDADYHAGGTLKVTEKLTATGTAKLNSTGDLYVKDMEAGAANVESQANVQVDQAKVNTNLTIQALGTLQAGTDTTKIETETGDMTLQSGSDMTITTAESGKNLIATSGGKLTADKLVAKGTADLDSVGDLYVKDLKAGSADLDVSEGNAKVDTATVTEKISIDTVKGNIETGTVTTKDADFNSGGTLTADTLNATGTADLNSKGDLHVKDLSANIADIDVSEGNAKVDTATVTEKISIDTLKGNIETGTVTAKDADFNSGGTLTADTLKASGFADLDSVGNLYVKDLAAGKADIDVTAGDAKVDKALVQDTLSIDARGDVTTGTTETKEGSTAITAGKNVSIGTLTSGENAIVKAKGGDLTADAITANKLADLYSSGKMTVGNLISKAGDIVGTSGGAMDMGKVEALNGKVTLKSDSTMDVDDLDAKNADLISKDTMTVIDSQIAETLKMNSGKDIIVNRSDSVTLDMDADGSIKAETMNGKSAIIHTGSGTLKAGGDILITDKDAVEKLQGVDTSQPAGKTNGAGEAGSLYLADATPSTFDVSKKGDAVLSVDKALTMTGKNVEADTVQTGSGVDHISINADNLGIDDLQSEADKLHVIIHGSDGETQSHYAGLHTTSNNTVAVKDSRIETLNFTGKDNIGIESTALGGNSTMQNDFIRFELRKNPRTDMAEWISRIYLHGYGIDTDHPMSRADDGIPINGDPTADTAYSAMNRSLYGRDYLGKDGREKEEEEKEIKGLHFGEVSPKETYDAVGASEQ